MGWKGFTQTRERIFGEVADQLIRHAPCDLLLLKVGEERRFKTCLFPTSGGPHARLAAFLLNELAIEHKMKITAAYVVPEDATQEQRDTGMNWIEETLAHIPESSTFEKKLIESKSIAGGLALASRDYDLVVIGAAKEPFFRKVLFGEIPEKVARYSPTSVLVVKQHEGPVKSLFKKAFG